MEPPADLVRGLVNRGNTCFLNGTLQALAAVSPAHRYLAAVVDAASLLREARAAHARESASRDAEACRVVTRAFGGAPSVVSSSAVLDYSDPDNGGAAVAGVLSLLRALSWPYASRAPAALAPYVSLGAFAGGAFEDGAQHDAHELLTRMMQGVDDDVVRLAADAAARESREATWRGAALGAAGGRLLHAQATCAFATRDAVRRRRRGGAALDSVGAAKGFAASLQPLSLRSADAIWTGRSRTVARTALGVLFASGALRDPFVGHVAERVVCEACAAERRSYARGDNARRAGSGIGGSGGRVALAAAAPVPLRATAAAVPHAPPLLLPPPRPWHTVPFTVLSVQPEGPRAPHGTAVYTAPSSLTIEACLAREFADEALPGDYRCDGEAALPYVRHPCVKQRALSSLPPALCVHVNRLQGEGAKVRRRVRFELTLDASPFVLAARDRGAAASGEACTCGSPGCRGATYELVALVEHSGGGRGGHYIAYRRVPAAWPDTGGEAAADPAPLWIVASDETVRPIDVDEVLEREAYMLFYVRRCEGEAAPAGGSSAAVVVATRDAWSAARVAAELALLRGGAAAAVQAASQDGVRCVWFPSA